MLCIDRIFQFMIIVMFSFFIVLSTIGGPGIAKTFKNKVSHYTVSVILVKETEGGANKAGQMAEFCSPSCSFIPTASHIASFRHETRIAPTHETTRIPARSPPFVG